MPEPEATPLRSRSLAALRFRDPHVEFAWEQPLYCSYCRSRTDWNDVYLHFCNNINRVRQPGTGSEDWQAILLCSKCLVYIQHFQVGDCGLQRNPLRCAHCHDNPWLFSPKSLQLNHNPWTELESFVTDRDAPVVYKQYTTWYQDCVDFLKGFFHALWFALEEKPKEEPKKEAPKKLENNIFTSS